MGKENATNSALRAASRDSSYPEKRCGADRRTNKKARLKYLFFNGRRERTRREDDRRNAVFFDRYNQKLFAAITAILLLSIFDALLTLALIERGSSELNPVMEYFLEYGPLHFIIAKYILTCFGVLILLIFKNVFLTKVNIYTYSLFPCVIVAFSTVILWELYLFFTAL
jgi:hypothetical protein